MMGILTDSFVISFLGTWNKDNFWEIISIYCDCQPILDM